SIALGGLGLVHVHVFLDAPNDRWLELPVILSASWVNHGLEQPGLYLHCAIPTSAKDEFAELVRTLAERWCNAYTLIATGDSWQSIGPLPSLFDHRGVPRARREPTMVRRTPASPAESGLLRSYPFAVPAIFEAPEERVSLHD